MCPPPTIASTRISLGASLGRSMRKMKSPVWLVVGVTTACEYLADRGLIGKAAVPAHLTIRSNVDVQELAFFHLEEPPDAF